MRPAAESEGVLCSDHDTSACARYPRKVAATRRLAGSGREDPNANPKLETPIRFNFSFPPNPLAMLITLLGPEMCTKLFAVGCCVLCIVLAGFIVPVAAGQVVGAQISGLMSSF